MSVECKEFGYWQGYRCHLITLKNKNGFILLETALKHFLKCTAFCK